MNDLHRRIGHPRPPIIPALIVSMLAVGCGQGPRADRVTAKQASRPLQYVWVDGGTGGRMAARTLMTASMEIRGLRAAGVPTDAPAIRQAATFLASCQRIDDSTARSDGGMSRERGGFASSPVDGSVGVNRGRPFVSATCMGIAGLLDAGVPRDDFRIHAALVWLERHYSLDAHPGMDRPREGLYAFYYEFANAMEVLGRDEIRDARGVPHDWRAELSRRLAEQQAADGGWANPEESARVGRNGRMAVTSYVLLTLGRIRH